MYGQWNDGGRLLLEDVPETESEDSRQTAKKISSND